VPARRAPLPNPATLIARGFDWTGRSPQEEALAMAALAGLPLAWLRLGPSLVADWHRGHEAAGIVPLALLAVPALGIAVRRLTDMGARGWWAWLLALPLIRWALVAALLLAPSSQRRPRPRTGWRAAGMGVAALAGLGALGSLAFATAPVLAQGMRPALWPGEVVLIRRAPLVLAPGDVVALRLPGEAETRWGRILARGGDRIAVEDGRPVLDGTALPQAQAGWLVEPFGPQGPRRTLPVCGNGAVGLGADCRTRRLTETLPSGRSHIVLDAGPRPLDRTDEAVVPAGRLFLMGDDRDAARDSRLAPAAGGMGLVPEEAVLGRAGLVVASSATRLWDPRGWRLSRLLARVR
jgi:signal peptidase I